MTGPSADMVVCRQCGTLNASGDQFCGNCGTFLEWSAEPIEGAAAPGVPTTAIPSTANDDSLAGLLSPTPASPSGAGASSGSSTAGAGAATSGVGAAGASPATAGALAASTQLVRCPTCGTANVAGKTFCLKCGNKLAGATAATRLPLPPREDRAAGAGAAPSAGAPVVGGASPSREAVNRRREPAREGGGISGWIVVVGAGIAVGVIIVVLVLVLGSGKAPPPAAASAAPSASIVASQAPSASVAPSRPAKTAKPTAKPKPTK
jgi:ribosomal protein L32